MREKVQTKESKIEVLELLWNRTVKELNIRNQMDIKKGKRLTEFLKLVGEITPDVKLAVLE